MAESNLQNQNNSLFLPEDLLNGWQQMVGKQTFIHIKENTYTHIKHILYIKIETSSPIGIGIAYQFRRIKRVTASAFEKGKA